MWMYASEPYASGPNGGIKGVSRFYENLIEMLWKMFPLHSEFHQRWRMTLFISGASLECEYTVSGWVTSETKVYWDNVERNPNDNYPGVATPYPNVAVNFPVPPDTFF